MISYHADDCRFNFRTAAVVVRDARDVLVHRGPDDEFWTLPGGRLEMGESSAQAVMREIGEELRVGARVVRTLWIVENFFRYRGERCHELCVYHLVALDEGCDVLAREGEFIGWEPEIDAEIVFRWQPLDRLDELVLLPSFLRDGLRALPDAVEHVVHADASWTG